MASSVLKQHIPIFVSSTYKDLAEHRAEVERKLVGLEQIVKGMEFFGSSPDTPLETCLQKIEESKLMILLIGVSYGSIVPSVNKSFTEMEYDYAISKDIPILVYIADTSSSTIGIPIDSVDTVHYSQLEKFKESLKKTHTVSFFKSIEDLGARIEHDVPEILTKLEKIKIKNTKYTDNVDEDQLKQGADKFEKFWLRPARYIGEVVPLRLRINSKWGGWRVKDELIQALGLDVGDTISNEVSVFLSKGIIDDDDDGTDIFASNEGADWLLDNATYPGSIVDCYVRFTYCKAPIGINGKIINKVSLVFVKGIRLVGYDNNYALSMNNPDIFNLTT